MKLLYLGNQLSKYGFNKTTIETLGFQLEQEGFHVYYASNKKSFPFRMLDMMWSVILYRKQVSYILIDTYIAPKRFGMLLFVVSWHEF